MGWSSFLIASFSLLFLSSSPVVGWRTDPSEGEFAANLWEETPPSSDCPGAGYAHDCLWGVNAGCPRRSFPPTCDGLWVGLGAAGSTPTKVTLVVGDLVSWSRLPKPPNFVGLCRVQSRSSNECDQRLGSSTEKLRTVCGALDLLAKTLSRVHPRPAILLLVEATSSSSSSKTGATDTNTNLHAPDWQKTCLRKYG